jgi:hypothetical protein
VSQLAKPQLLQFCHSGLDPESSAVSRRYGSGCRIKPGMTGRNISQLESRFLSITGGAVIIKIVKRFYRGTILLGEEKWSERKFPFS